MDLAEVMRTTFACREFSDQAVGEAQIARILEQARFAPSGGNRQGWRVLVIRERAVRERFAELIAPPMKRYVAQLQAGENPYNSIDPSELDEATIADTEVPLDMIRQMVDAPVLLLICVDLRLVASFDADLGRVGLVSGASIYPFAWNILLAARNEGLGGTLTTFLVPAEAEVQELLGIPSHVALAALLPIGRPVKQLTVLKRNPVESFARFDRWDGAPLGVAD